MSSLMDKQVKDCVPETAQGWCGCICCSITMFVLAILFFPAFVKQLGQHKIGLAKDSITGVIDLETVYTPGRYWLGFWKNFVEFPSTLQTIQFSSESPEEGVQDLGNLEARDMQGEPLRLDITIQYRLHSDKVGQIYREFTTLFEDVYISELRQALSQVFGDIQIREAWEDYPAVRQRLHDACRAALTPRHADCWGFQLWGVSTSNLYESRMITTQVQKQAQRTEAERLVHRKYRAETMTLMGSYDVRITEIRAAGRAEVIDIEGESRARAEQRVVEAQSQMLERVRDLVVLQMPDGSNVSMNEQQQMTYQQQVMLQRHSSASYMYTFKSALELLQSQR